MTSSCPVEIAVVGGGASAVCLLDALATATTTPGGLTVFEPTPLLWRGRPFRPDLATVRVNAPPEEMSVRAGDSGHFSRWLMDRGFTEDTYSRYGSHYPPRALYGDYLAQSAQNALVRLAESGWRVQVVRERVTAAHRKGNTVELQTGSARRRSADHVVLCVGGHAPADPYRLTGRPNVVVEPYPLAETMPRIPAQASVGVLGTGLTGVDVVLALAGTGHTGPITMLSRSGVLPAVRQRVVPYELRHFTVERLRAASHPLTLSHLVGLMSAELAEAGETMDPIVAELAALRAEEPIARLRRHLAEVDSPSIALRILQRAVPDTGPDVWPYLAEADRNRVVEQHYRALMSLCCPMPPASAAILLDLAGSGQLKVRGGVTEVTGDREVACAGSVERFDVLINAIQVPRHRIAPDAKELVASLVTGGAAEPHPRGGLAVDRQSSRFTVDGRPQPGGYALGDLTSGSLLFTFGLPSLVDRAVDIAAALGADTRTRQSQLQEV